MFASHTFGALVVLLGISLFSSGCCRSASLPADQDLAGRVQVDVVVRRSPEFTMDQPEANTNAREILNGGQMMITTVSARRELRRGASEEVVGSLLEEAIAYELETRLGLEIVEGAEETDLSLLFSLRSHGVSNRLGEGDPIFYMRSRAELYEEPRHRRIWRMCQDAQRSLIPGMRDSDIHGPVLSDFDALDGMSSADFTSTFEALSRELASTLVVGIARNR